MTISKRDLEEIKSAIVDQMQNVFTEEFLQDISAKVWKIIERNFNKKMEEQQEEIKVLRSEIAELKIENVEKGKILDKHEQLYRNSNIRIFGVQQTPEEDIYVTVLDLFHNKMNLKSIQLADIKSCYRINSKNATTDKPRSSTILVRFFTDNIRLTVLKNRKSLKSTGIRISEDLTKIRLGIFKSAVNKFTKKNVWCRNGIVFVKCNGTVCRADDAEQIRIL